MNKEYIKDIPNWEKEYLKDMKDSLSNNRWNFLMVDISSHMKE